MNIEIDVGLHRGGVGDPAELARMLAVIDEDPRIELAGLMGYEAHVAKLASLAGEQAREFERVRMRYQRYLEVLSARF